MEKHFLQSKIGIFAVAVGSLTLGIVCTFAFQAAAFVGPTQAPSVGSGAIGSDNSNNIAVGTGTTISGTKFVVLGASNDASTYAAKIESNNGTPMILVRDDGAVSIATSTLTVGNTTIGNNLVVGGTITANNLGGSTISAGNVSAGSFGYGTGGGTYSFPGVVNLDSGDYNGVGVFPNQFFGVNWKSSWGPYLSSAGQLGFAINGHASPDVIINGNGLGVGISPGAKLDVGGGIRLEADGSDDGPLQVNYTSAGPAGYYATYAP